MTEDTRIELEQLRELKQADYNLSRWIRDNVAPDDAHQAQSREWPLKLKALGCPVTG